jgi:glycosyltransferase involved in cell wall biosynthesis
MRVALINSTFEKGSTGRIVSDINHILKERGYATFIGFGRDGQEKHETYKMGSRISLYYHVLITRLFDKHGKGSYLATRKLFKKLKNFKPDIIHLHNIHGYYINYEVLFKHLNKMNVPVIWTLHDCWAFTGHCAFFDYANCSKWKTECNKCPEKIAYPKSVFIDSSKSNYASKKKFFTSLNNCVIVTPSEWLANNVRQSFLAPYPVKVINNGIDIEVFKPTNSKFIDQNNLNGKYVILGVANVWDRRKGLNYFIELDKVLGDDYKIVLVGLSDLQISQLPESIIKIKRTNSQKDLAEVYTSANVFLNPTLEDNFPTTNLEAIACGTPVITFDTGGCSEIIDETTGVVVKDKTVQGIISSIQMVRKVSKDYYTQNCIEKARTHFNKAVKYEQYIDLYLKNI